MSSILKAVLEAYLKDLQLLPGVVLGVGLMMILQSSIDSRDRNSRAGKLLGFARVGKEILR